jgi:hypothetical protein
MRTWPGGMAVGSTADAHHRQWDKWAEATGRRRPVAAYGRRGVHGPDADQPACRTLPAQLATPYIYCLRSRRTDRCVLIGLIGLMGTAELSRAN